MADETLIKPGQKYTKRELRLAVYRVRRLPFVINAEYTLRKGESDGSVLVIEVVEETSVFLSVGTNGQRSQQFDPAAGRNRTKTTWQQFGTLGGRTFVGSNGLAEGSVQKLEHQDGELIQGSYTQYDLFGAGTVAGGALDSVQDVKGYDQLQASLFAGIPLTAAQSLRATLFWGDSRQSAVGETFKDVGRGAGLSWLYNTTDDLLFPMSGSSGFVDWSYTRDASHEHVSFEDQQLSRNVVTDIRALSAGVTHYFPVTPHQSFSLGANVYRSTLSSDDGVSNVPWQWTLALGHAITLLGFDRAHRYGDLRFENFVAANYYYLDATSNSVSRSSRDASFVSSLGYRCRWGVLRATLTYSGLWRSH
ncbi:MAG TPA: hypothetical protein VH988_34175 [Thermoanaerobaculia bacterium]|nr:hypothetical protein [Thermoanaerobaculia bacterium]